MNTLLTNVILLCLLQNLSAIVNNLNGMNFNANVQRLHQKSASELDRERLEATNRNEILWNGIRFNDVKSLIGSFYEDEESDEEETVLISNERKVTEENSGIYVFSSLL